MVVEQELVLLLERESQWKERELLWKKLTK
jgi:hypothetical protein